MTNASLITALILATAIAGIVGWLSRRWSAMQSSSASIAVSVATFVTLPILLHPGDGWLRMLSPKEALEWIPLGLLLLLAIELLHDRQAKLANFWRAAGIACCLLFAARMLWGSIYLRPGSLQGNYMTFLLIWSSSIAWTWTARSKVAPEKSNLLEGILQLALLLIVTVNLGLSGSIKYFATGLLFSVASAASWIGSRRLSNLTSVACIALLGLGPTFSETSWWVASLLLLAALGASLVSRCNSSRKRIVITTFVLTTAVLASSLTGYKFWQTISNKADASSGYEAYR